MKGVHQQLPKGPEQSFIVYHEKLPFPKYHFHPEYELVYIQEGRGTLLVGDYVGCFRENDMIFLGPYLPHEHRIDSEYFGNSGEFNGRALVIHFTHDCLGKEFLIVPENRNLLNFLSLSSRGCRIHDKSRYQLAERMYRMLDGNPSENLFRLMEIFRIFSTLEDCILLSSPGFVEPYRNKGCSSISKAIEYIIKNFQKDIKVRELLDLTLMSNTKFSNEFRRVTRMSFKAYLNKVRIGYAGHLLTQGEMNVSEIAFQAGFENLSNFNRQFKKLMLVTPKQYSVTKKREAKINPV